MDKKRAFITALVCLFTVTIAACQGSYFGGPAPGAEVPPIYGTLSGNTGTENTVTLYATGKGIPPNYANTDGQAKIMAERAAIADAYRLLAEKIRGTFLSSRQQVDNMAVDYDRIKMSTTAWLRGAEIVSVKRTTADVVEAVVKVTIPADAPQKTAEVNLSNVR